MKSDFNWIKKLAFKLIVRFWIGQIFVIWSCWNLILNHRWFDMGGLIPLSLQHILQMATGLKHQLCYVSGGATTSFRSEIEVQLFPDEKLQLLRYIGWRTFCRWGNKITFILKTTSLRSMLSPWSKCRYTNDYTGSKALI